MSSVIVDHHDIEQFFIQKTQGVLRWDVSAKEFKYYSNGVWGSKAPFASMFRDIVCKQYLEHRIEQEKLRPDEAARLQNALVKEHTLSAIERMIRRDLEVQVENADFNKDPFFLNCLNGVVDLRDGSLIPHAPEYLMSKQIQLNWNPEARCPTWEQAIKTVMSGNPDEIRYLRLRLGSLLWGANPEQTACWFTGAGKNGKSTIVDCFLDVLGPYAELTQPSTFQAKQGRSELRPEFEPLTGVRGVICPELSGNLDQENFKQITGETRVAFRTLYGRVQTVRLTWKMVCTSNDPPKCDNSPAIRRRIHILPFRHTFTEVDPTFIPRLRSEHEGILNWLIQACMEWYQVVKSKSLLEPTDLMREEADKLFTERDEVQEWVSQCCDIGEGKQFETTFRALRESFMAYYKMDKGNPSKRIREGLLRVPGVREIGRTAFDKKWTGIRIKDE